MDPKESPELINSRREKIDEVIEEYIRLFREYTDNHVDSPVQVLHLMEHLKIVIGHDKQFKLATSDLENFPTITQIEEMMVDLRRRLNEVDLKALLTDMRQINAEDTIIEQKKIEYRMKGIRLRKQCRYQTSIMTIIGRVIYERMALKAATDKDAAKLLELGVKGYVFPLDEFLGINRLPFKVSIGAMLEIVRESTRCESYEDAQKILQERSDIIINDDIMRKITNVIGTLVFNNEVKQSEAIWDDFCSGKLAFPDQKYEHTLFLEVDGAMLPTREEGKKGVVYKENKLGMAFSSDNFTWWTDKHGKKQHRIDKREYTSLLGDNLEFKKLMFSLAIRNGYGKYKNTVLISDGATWIRNMKEELFPDAQQILDYYHFKEHVVNYGKIIYNNDDDKVKPWADKISLLFLNGQKQVGIAMIKQTSKHIFRKQLDLLLQYIYNNWNNIDYDKYKLHRYFIGSGAIESSNKTVMQRRMKYGAMRWNIQSGQAVVTLVAKSRSGLWNRDVVDAIYSHYGETQGYAKKISQYWDLK
jgi:hypothetical protein